jgi:transcriptional regulator with XRE-family HTH domain
MIDLDPHRSARDADLQEFGEAVLRAKRKKLGLTQQQMARKIGVHQSRIARIELGTGIPKDHPTAKKYSDSYKLTEEEENKFYQLIFGVEPQFLTLSPTVIEVFVDTIETIHQVRIQGNPQLAGMRADVTANRLNELKRVFHTASTTRDSLLKIYGRVLNERSWIYKETLAPRSVPVTTKPLINEMHAIAAACRDSELYGLFAFQKASTFYMMGQYVASLPLLTTALGHLKSSDDRLAVLRAIALSWSYLKDKTRFEETETKIRRIIEGGKCLSLERICQSLEGLGRAQGVLRLPRALKTMEEGWKIYAQMLDHHAIAPFRHVQLVRSHLEIAKHTEGKDPKLFENLGSEGLRVSQQHGYPRHELIIRSFLTEILG